jgi:hypothetical protein
MARVCRECQEPVSWDAKVCPRCGEENPLGRNPGDLALMTIFGISTAGLIGWLAFFFVRMMLQAASHSH